MQPSWPGIEVQSRRCSHDACSRRTANQRTNRKRHCSRTAFADLTNGYVVEWSGGRSTLRRGGVCAGAHAEQATRFLLGRHRLGRGALPGKAFDAVRSLLRGAERPALCREACPQRAKSVAGSHATHTPSAVGRHAAMTHEVTKQPRFVLSCFET